MPTRSRMRLWSGAARDKFATAGASSSRGAMPSGGSNDRCALIMLGDANCSTSYSRSICRLFLDPAKIVPCNEIGNDIDGGYVQADLDADPGDHARQMSKPGWLEFDGGAALEVRSRFKNPIGDLERCARALPLALFHRDPASKAKPRQSAYRRRPRLPRASRCDRHVFDRRELHKKIIPPPDPLCNSRIAPMQEPPK